MDDGRFEGLSKQHVRLELGRSGLQLTAHVVVAVALPGALLFNLLTIGRQGRVRLMTIAQSRTVKTTSIAVSYAVERLMDWMRAFERVRIIAIGEGDDAARTFNRQDGAEWPSGWSTSCAVPAAA